MTSFIKTLQENIEAQIHKDSEAQNPDQNTLFFLRLQDIPFQKLQPPIKQLIESLSDLSYLTITHCDLRTFENFPLLPSLHSICVSHNRLQGTFQYLMKLKFLNYLDASSNIIKQVSKLAPLRRIKGLTCCFENNPVEKISGYRGAVEGWGLILQKQPRQVPERYIKNKPQKFETSDKYQHSESPMRDSPFYKKKDNEEMYDRESDYNRDEWPPSYSSSKDRSRKGSRRYYSDGNMIVIRSDSFIRGLGDLRDKSRRHDKSRREGFYSNIRESSAVVIIENNHNRDKGQQRHHHYYEDKNRHSNNSISSKSHRKKKQSDTIEYLAIGGRATDSIMVDSPEENQEKVSLFEERSPKGKPEVIEKEEEDESKSQQLEVRSQQEEQVVESCEEEQDQIEERYEREEGQEEQNQQRQVKSQEEEEEEEEDSESRNKRDRESFYESVRSQSAAHSEKF